MFARVDRVERKSLYAVAAQVVECGIVGGTSLGALDLLAQRYFAYPWANLANSPAVWGVAGFLLAWGQRRMILGVAGAVIMLPTAVLAYYLAAAVVLGDDVANAFSSVAVFWYAGGVGIGVVAGLAGALCRCHRRWQVVIGAAFPPALLLAEGSIQNRVLLGPLALAWLFATIAVIYQRRDLTTAAAVSVTVIPMAMLGHAAYLALGLHGFAA